MGNRPGCLGSDITRDITRVAPTQSVLRRQIERLCYILGVIDELTYDRPLNYIEAAMVTALLRAARQFRALSPKSNYRTVYELTVNNIAVCSFKIKGQEVAIRE